ncbi:restriction endonuclease subunit S [Alicyclobacillus macrosporangiidus]|uniref:restriction endonuclease subunit S n=1 Tax=Alicyclobacillus macrosporangiidus TaxID=392015 RepID=UPI00158785D8|nr:restriction endonuclease subunit S [Alicyclobacillus macrosporangiidus]
MQYSEANRDVGTTSEWSAHVPEGWKFVRLDSVFDLVRNTIRQKDMIEKTVFHYSIPSVQDYGDGRIESGDEISSDKFLLSGGELIVSKLNPRKATVLLTKPQGIPIVASTEFVVLRPKAIHPKYALYLYLSHWVREKISSVVQSATKSHQRANPSEIYKLWTPLPNLDEQVQIASFLDHETAKLDQLVEKKQRLIELLQEYRQALITQAVTKGLDPNVPMKDSGIPWLGEVPAHWQIVRLKFIAEVRSGVTKGRDLTGKETVELPYLRVANVQDGYLDLSDVATIPVMKSEIPRYSLRKGDVLMNEGGDFDKLGRGTRWNGEIEPCLHQNHVFAVRPHDIDYSDWINLYTSSEPAKRYFILKSKQTTNLASISSTNIQELQIPFPDKAERDEILEYVSSVTKKLDRLVSVIEHQVDLLREYRQALITAAVTGQIDVRQYSPDHAEVATP